MKKFILLVAILAGAYWLISGRYDKPAKSERSPIAAPIAAFDSSKVQASELPKTVRLKSPEEFPVAGSSSKVTVPPGATVNVLAQSGDFLSVRFIRGDISLHHSRTTFAEQIQTNRNERRQRAERAYQADLQAATAEYLVKEETRTREKAILTAEVGEKPKPSPGTGEFYEVNEFMQSYLKDPKSAEYIEFSKVKLVDWQEKKAWAVKVRLRAKNSFGAYDIEQGIAFIRHGKVFDYQVVPE